MTENMEGSEPRNEINEVEMRRETDLDTATFEPEAVVELGGSRRGCVQ